MRAARRLALAAVLASASLAGHGTAVAVTPISASTCLGQPVTVVGVVGTEGDDVMRAPLDAWTEVEGRGGDDTICLVDGNPGSRDPMFFADAGPGDDVVSYEASYPATVRLGAGADRFVGNDAGAHVYTGASAPIPGGVGYFGQQDTEADVVLAGAGRDSVYSGDTGESGDTPNPDRIATGASSGDHDSVFYAGRMTPEGGIDNGSSPDLLFLVGRWGPGVLTIDDVAGRADLGGSDVLRWSDVRELVVDERPEAVRFLGGPQRDRLTVGDTQLPAPGGPMDVEISTGGGRDDVALAGAIRGRIGLGGGRDGLTLGGACGSTRVVLGSHLLCREGTARARTQLAGVERLLVRGPDVVAIGTAGADRISVHGEAPRVLGRGGRDSLDATGRGGLVDGGPGRDRCSGPRVRRCER